VTGDIASVDAMGAAAQQAGKDVHVLAGTTTVTSRGPGDSIATATITVFEGSSLMQPAHPDQSLGANVLGTFIHESAHVPSGGGEHLVPEPVVQQILKGTKSE